jgi:hypothetical protein
MTHLLRPVCRPEVPGTDEWARGVRQERRFQCHRGGHDRDAHLTIMAPDESSSALAATRYRVGALRTR